MKSIFRYIKSRLTTLYFRTLGATKRQKIDVEEEGWGLETVQFAFITTDARYRYPEQSLESVFYPCLLLRSLKYLFE